MTIDLLETSLIVPVDAKLKDDSSFQLVLADQQDVEPLR